MFWFTRGKSPTHATPAVHASAICRRWRATCASTLEKSPTPWVRSKHNLPSTGSKQHVCPHSVGLLRSNLQVLVCFPVWEMWPPLPTQEPAASAPASETRGHHQHQDPLQGADRTIPVASASLLKINPQSKKKPTTPNLTSNDLYQEIWQQKHFQS